MSVLPYILLDSGNLRKLEQAGPYRIVRPALNAFWRPSLPKSEWDASDGVFERNSSGGGTWHWREKVPANWQLHWGGFDLEVKPTNFGHLGFFAEQRSNWEKFRKLGEAWGDLGQYSALNLFGYSGVGSMAMASAGFGSVCHLDASRGMIEWGRENLKLNPSVPDRIRWIADDVMKFCKREVRRGNVYQLIALDPPTFGRGSGGQVWKIEEDLPKLLALCREMYDKSRPFTISLSSHSPGFSGLVMEHLLRDAFGGKGKFSCREMTVPERSGRLYPAGICAELVMN